MTGLRVAFLASDKPLFGNPADEIPAHFAPMADTRADMPQAARAQFGTPFPRTPRPARGLDNGWAGTFSAVHSTANTMLGQFERAADASVKNLPAHLRHGKFKARWHTSQGLQAELFKNLTESFTKDINRKRTRFNMAYRKALLQKMVESLETSISHHAKAAVKSRGTMFNQAMPDDEKLQKLALYAEFMESRNRRSTIANNRR